MRANITDFFVIVRWITPKNRIKGKLKTIYIPKWSQQLKVFKGPTAGQGDWINGNFQVWITTDLSHAMCVTLHPKTDQAIKLKAKKRNIDAIQTKDIYKRLSHLFMLICYGDLNDRQHDKKLHIPIIQAWILIEWLEWNYLLL